MAKIAGVVILYNPGKEVIKNILSYSGHIAKLYMVDNSQRPSTIHLEQSLHGINYEIIHDSANRGIAYRLNQVANLAINNDYDLLLTMDQDSFFEESDILHYMKCSDAINWNFLAMAGVVFDGQKDNLSGCELTLVTDLITSGSILNLHLFNSIGGFDENLFIDEVDHDYCYTAIEKGYNIGRFENIKLTHTLGEQSQQRSFKNFQLSSRALHSPIRLYYMTRNYLYVKQKHPGLFINEMKNKRKSLLVRIKNNLLYGNDRLKILKYILKGVLDFKNHKMGALSK